MLLFAPNCPREAYRRVDFDARVSGADPMELVCLCCEQVITALGTALFANDRGDNRAKSRAMTRAVAALTALQLGVSGEDGIAPSLRHFYDAARRALLDNVLSFDAATIGTIRQDFIEVGEAMTAGRSRGH